MKSLAWYITILPRAIKSLYLSRYISKRKSLFSIRVKKALSKVIIKKATTAKFIVNGKITIEPFYGGREPVYISLADNSTLIVDGDLTIGNGIQIILDPGAELYIGGKKDESAAGFTERTRIMVRRKMHIGVDCIIAWGVYITDSDWHTIYGQDDQADVHIGDHVWIASNATILKGSFIGNNCIVAANALVVGENIPEASLVGGIPARILRRDVTWQRDL